MTTKPSPGENDSLATPPGGTATSGTPRAAGWRTAAVGVAMGSADIVPGVSGGTVALILGVYERLLTALSRIDSTTAGLVGRGQFVEAWRRVDGRFLALLGLGIAVGVKGLASVMNYLLNEQTTPTFAAFFGLIFASGILVARMTRPATPVRAAWCVALGIVAAAFAVWLMSQGRLTPIDHLGYTFVCGAIAICAMILPGISGAYLLLILGRYEEISEIVHRLPSIGGDELATLAVFAAGCLTGLLCFSRLLKWLLERYWSATMAVLAGFMIGSLYRVWPFQVDTTPEVTEFKQKVFEPRMPNAFDSEVIACAVIAVVCFVLVLTIDAIANSGAALPEEPAG